MCFIAATCATIVCVPRRSVSSVSALELRLELDGEALGRQLDRRQRVLDLVREAPRDLGPRRVALRQHQLGNVVEHDDVARVAARRSSRDAAHQQRPRQAGHAESAPRAATVRRGAAEAFGHEFGERRERRQPPSPVRQRDAGRARRAAAAGSPLALGFAVRSRWRSSNASTPADRLPSTLSRYARVVSIARRDVLVASHARRRAAPVIVLNDSVSTPSSSRDVTGCGA